MLCPLRRSHTRIRPCFASHNRHTFNPDFSHIIRSSSTSSGKKPYYITTPIYYPNAVPHIGHLYSLVIADIFARHARFCDPGRQAQLITGTDEHGMKIQRAARDRGTEPQAFCDDLSLHFRNLVSRADADVTRFIRTTEPEHKAAVQYLWRKLDEKGFIYKGTHKGWYSVSDEAFYTDAQVTHIHHNSTPPPAGSNSSTPKLDLSLGLPTPQTHYTIATETGSRVEWTQEENYKFRLSHFARGLRDHFEADAMSIFPPEKRDEVLGWLGVGKNGDENFDTELPDLSISRPRSRLTWGVQVPGDSEHTVYVWLDALTSYLTAAGFPWTAKGENGALVTSPWPADLQIIGKDILRFHALYLPAFLLALDLPLTRCLLAHAHWTANRQKMSKSIGNVADPIAALDAFGVDIVRFYLARVGGRFRDDNDWSVEQLRKHAEELTSNLGNFFLRITSAKIQCRLPESIQRGPFRFVEDMQNVDVTADALSAPLANHVHLLADLPIQVDGYLRRYEVGEALRVIIECLQSANKLLTDATPWRYATPDEIVLKSYMTSMETLRITGLLLQPFIPTGASTLLDALGVPRDQRSLEWSSLGKGDMAVPLEGGAESGEGEGAENAGGIRPVRLFDLPNKPTESGAGGKLENRAKSEKKKKRPQSEMEEDVEEPDARYHLEEPDPVWKLLHGKKQHRLPPNALYKPANQKVLY